ncbi:RagB/SusD family nutrient uptake outer membrane protein [Dinghuibacter silviterrae]|nr:RagB/SusD family nutrient uptake outer membrane protein [Dinghuibacter silviterrae]
MRRYILVLLCASLAGCEKYVNIKTQGTLVPGSYENYREMLDNTSEWEPAPFLGDYASDDVQFVDSSAQVVSLSSDDFYAHITNCYRWLPTIYLLGTYYAEDDNWNALYNTIAYANIVITEAPSATGATPAQIRELIAEALVHRADAYLGLVNTYAKPYTAATASTDLGVPLVLTETTTQSLTRATMQDTYTQVLKDLRTALPSLPATQAFNTLPSIPAVFGELARCFLYMNEYDSAAKYADSALSYRNTLDDLTQYQSISAANYPLRKADPEVLLSKVAGDGVSGYPPTAMRLSDTLLHVLDTTDQRYVLFTTDGSNIGFGYTGRYFYKDAAMGEARNDGPSVPEMMLIKAEALARAGDASGAMNWVNALRQKRFVNYVPLTATNAADGLQKVLQEREREFFCRMLRWWDMRRLKSDPTFQETLTRVFEGVTYTLAPTSNRYVFRISDYDEKLNPEIQQNP